MLRPPAPLRPFQVAGPVSSSGVLWHGGPWCPLENAPRQTGCKPVNKHHDKPPPRTPFLSASRTQGRLKVPLWVIYGQLCPSAICPNYLAETRNDLGYQQQVNMVCSGGWFVVVLVHGLLFILDSRRSSSVEVRRWVGPCTMGESRLTG